MLPLSELITRNVVDTLRGISPAAGFNVELKVQRFKRRPDPPEDLQAIVMAWDDEADADANTPIGFTAWVRPYWVQVYRFESDETPAAGAASWEELLNVARADVEKALAADLTRGGLATDTRIVAPAEFSDSGDAGGIVVRVNVHYRHPFDNPYPQAGQTVPAEET